MAPDKRILLIYKSLLRVYGKQGWWPLSSMAGKRGFDARGYHQGDHTYPKNDIQRWEIIVGAILTQSTSWRNVEPALESLRNASFSPKSIAKIKEKKLAWLIRSSGYHNQKARKLKCFAGFFLSKPEINRESLLGVWGVGPETADSILLYAYRKPIFVIDAYTKRIMQGVGYKGDSYEQLQSLFMANLPPDHRLFNEYHALLVEHGKKFCRKNPVCESCPIKGLCSTGSKKHIFTIG